MLAGGALDEVAALRATGVEPSATAARILGLDEIAAHLDGLISLDECRERLVVRTRRYARRSGHLAS